jgi:hypothetical protein
MSQGDRREFLKKTAGLAITAGLSSLGNARPGHGLPDQQIPTPAPGTYGSAEGFSAPKLETVRVGFVGIGLQGGGHVRNFLRLENVEIRALCDVDEGRAAEVRQWVADEDRPAPDLYTRGERDFLRLCDRDDIDLVLTATPWRWHVPVCIAAMERGKHVATEVPASYTVDGCWQLVETAERTEQHCVMLENCCYGRREMMMLNIVRAGLLGELLHAEGGYLHDLRSIKFSDQNEGLWRLAHSMTRNGNLYPSHGIGPIAQCLDINRGDRMERIVSMSSPARGLARYAMEKLPADDPRRRQRYALGDMNTSLIQTVLGRTIMLQHDTTTPRPYSRIDLMQGTRGVFAGYPDRIHIEGKSPAHEWEDPETYRAAWDHPLWQQVGEAAEGAGHGGKDFLEDWRLVRCLRQGTATDMDVYDAAAWSVLTELSERSVSRRAEPSEIPDFTRGGWRIRQPLGIVV